MTRFVCADPAHEGDRARIHPSDRCEERIEYRRLSDQGRERVVKVRDICKACIRRKHGISTTQVGLFG